jgi:hypothetical protein
VFLVCDTDCKAVRVFTATKTSGRKLCIIIRAGFAGLVAVALTIGAAVAQTQSAQPDNAMLDYEVTRFDGGAKNGADRADERALLTRFFRAF